MTTTPHLPVLRALELATIAPRAFEDRWLAVIEVKCQGFSQEQLSLLAENLVGVFEQDSNAYLVRVSDNTEHPIAFETREDALQQARQLGTSLISKYCFSVYCSTGTSIQYAPKPTLHFMPGFMKKT